MLILATERNHEPLQVYINKSQSDQLLFILIRSYIPEHVRTVSSRFKKFKSKQACTLEELFVYLPIHIPTTLPFKLESIVESPALLSTSFPP